MCYTSFTCENTSRLNHLLNHWAEKGWFLHSITDISTEDCAEWLVVMCKEEKKAAA